MNITATMLDLSDHLGPTPGRPDLFYRAELAGPMKDGTVTAVLYVRTEAQAASIRVRMGGTWSPSYGPDDRRCYVRDHNMPGWSVAVVLDEGERGAA